MSVKSVDSVIEVLGGIDAAAERCAISADAVRKWRANGCVPPKNWPKIVGGRITYAALEALWRDHGEPAPKSNGKTEAA